MSPESSITFKSNANLIIDFVNFNIIFVHVLGTSTLNKIIWYHEATIN